MFDRITVESGKLDGRPCIRGHQLSVAYVVKLVAEGRSLDQIQEEFPFVEPADVRQALLYAVDSAGVEL